MMEKTGDLLLRGRYLRVRAKRELGESRDHEKRERAAADARNRRPLREIGAAP
jgi:hypothetical protein